MNSILPEIYFYLPLESWPDPTVPNTIKSLSQEQWSAIVAKDPRRSNSSWILQTYLYLKESGFPCKLTNTWPQKGIVIAVRGSVPANLKPHGDLLLVCITADNGMHPYAQIHVVQNPAQTHSIPNSYFIPHWIQHKLIPRDSSRGDRFEQVAYFGCENNLIPELRDSSWSKKLRALGLDWRIIEPKDWHDYSNVDAILAIRQFGYHDRLNKPATKLHQAWHAGVPAILSAESAYRAERQNDYDYLEVCSISETLEALSRLKSDLTFRRAMITQGHHRSLEIQPESLIEKWQAFLTQTAIPTWTSWQNQQTWQQKGFLLGRYLELKKRGMQARVARLKSP